MTEHSVIDLRIRPQIKDLGEFPPGKGVNVRSHPHIGLATITYLFDGEMLHRDSLGFVQEIRAGEVKLQAGAKLELPETQELAVFVVAGDISREGRFDPVPGENDFIPLPESS